LYGSDLRALRVGIFYENDVPRQPGPTEFQLEFRKPLKNRSFF
jgi:hypothetical protein